MAHSFPHQLLQTTASLHCHTVTCPCCVEVERSFPLRRRGIFIAAKSSAGKVLSPRPPCQPLQPAPPAEAGQTGTSWPPHLQREKVSIERIIFTWRSFASQQRGREEQLTGFGVGERVIFQRRMAQPANYLCARQGMVFGRVIRNLLRLAYPRGTSPCGLHPSEIILTEALCSMCGTGIET